MRRLSLAHLTVMDADPVELIDAGAAGGFDTVGLRIVPPLPTDRIVPVIGDIPMQRRIKARLAETGLGLLDVEAIWLMPETSIAALLPALDLATTSGARLSFVGGDLADLEDHPRFIEAVFSAFGRIDCVVNNAGVSVMSRGDLLDVSVESYDVNFAVNTRGAFFLTQAVCRRMLAADGEFPESARSVVFISSSNAAIAASERGEYAMSKAAVAMMAKLYAVRLAPHGIAVYEVRPGLIRTPMTGVAQARFDKLIADGFTPINRMGHVRGRGSGGRDDGCRRPGIYDGRRDPTGFA